MPRIGVDLGGTKIEVAVLAADGSLPVRRRVPTPRDDYDATLTAVTQLVGVVEEACGSTCSVGVGHPGAVSPASGRIKNANSTCLNGHDLGLDLSQALGRQVRLANDADCFALSEALDGSGAGASPVFGAILGTGVGGGIVVEGKLLRGINAIAGEWGHNPMPADPDDTSPAPPCFCGRSGCVETWLSGPALVADARGVAADDAQEVFRLAQAGDAQAAAAVDRYMPRLARALATVINVVDPEVIVLGGGLSNVETLYRQIPRLWGPWVFSDHVATRLVPPRHGDSSGVRGAARLWPA